MRTIGRVFEIFGQELWFILRKRCRTRFNVAAADVKRSVTTTHLCRDHIFRSVSPHLEETTAEECMCVCHWHVRVCACVCVHVCVCVMLGERPNVEICLLLRTTVPGILSSIMPSPLIPPSRSLSKSPVPLLAHLLTWMNAISHAGNPKGHRKAGKEMPLPTCLGGRRRGHRMGGQSEPIRRVREAKAPNPCDIPELSSKPVNCLLCCRRRLRGTDRHRGRDRQKRTIKCVLH